MKTKVVHCKKEKYDILISRPSIWGNPYSHKSGTLAKFKTNTRAESIEKYREYILNNPELLSLLHTLEGKILGCWCKPKPCHGDVLVELIKERQKFMSSVDPKILEIAKKLKNNVKKGSKNFYAPLPKEESNIIREYFKNHLYISVEGDNNTSFYNHDGMILATGYDRVVIGDYGAYIEFSESNMHMQNIEHRWKNKGVGNRLIKYIWMQSKDDLKTKVYFQQAKVPYADYIPGKYYIDPSDLYTDSKDNLYDA